MSEIARSHRAAFPVAYAYASRWRDDDVYGHMNNVVYYEYFDTAVNRWLRESGALEPPRGPVIGLVAETACRYFAPVSFPAVLTVGLAAERIGRTSVTYRLGLFDGDAEAAAAACRYVHVYVDAETHRPTPIPETMRAALAGLEPADGR